MPGNVQNTILLFKPEATSGTSSAPTPAADAVLFWADDVGVKIEQKMAPRNVVRGYFSAPDSLPYARRGVVTFTTDWAAAGSLGVAPPMGKLLTCGAWSETVTATQRVDYLPASTNLKTGTLVVEWLDRIETFVYCAIEVVGLVIKAGESPKLKLQAKGLVSSLAVGQLGAPALTSWKRPEAVCTASTTKIRVGAVTYAAGVLSGGTEYPFNSVTVALGNVIDDPELVGEERLTINGRNPTAEIVLSGGPAAHVAWAADMNSGATNAFGLVHGSVAGSKMGLYCPTGVLTDLGDQAIGNEMFDSLKFTLYPTSAGNDEIRQFAI